MGHKCTNSECEWLNRPGSSKKQILNVNRPEILNVDGCAEEIDAKQSQLTNRVQIVGGIPNSECAFMCIVLALNLDAESAAPWDHRSDSRWLIMITLDVITR